MIRDGHCLLFNPELEYSNGEVRMRITNDGKLHSHAFATHITIPGYPVIEPDPLRFPVDTDAKVGRGDCHGHTL